MWTLNAGNYTTKALPTHLGRVPNRLRVSIRLDNGVIAWAYVYLLAYCQVTRRAWYDTDGLKGQIVMVGWDG